jgi:hypothetical protein
MSDKEMISPGKAWGCTVGAAMLIGGLATEAVTAIVGGGKPTIAAANAVAAAGIVLTSSLLAIHGYQHPERTNPNARSNPSSLES